MNIVIVGCGNVGFGTALRLASGHNLLLVDNRQPEYLSDLLKRHAGTCSFHQGDVMCLSGIESALRKAFGPTLQVDGLIYTVGTRGTATPFEHFARFRSEFELNYLGPIICLKELLPHMAGCGRVIVLTSTSGHHAERDLTAYACSKWALEAFCAAVRAEVRNGGVQLDVVSPRNIRNQYSSVFRIESGIDLELVVRRIENILHGPSRPRNFVPRHAVGLHILERLMPGLLDRRAGLGNAMGRRRRYRGYSINRVVITGVESSIGQAVARAYSHRCREMCLVGSNREVLERLQLAISAASGCSVGTAGPVGDDPPEWGRLAASFGPVDLVLNIASPGTEKDMLATPIEAYRRNLAVGFYQPVLVTSAFLDARPLPRKIVNILSPGPIAGGNRSRAQLAPLAALWAWTRALRRERGDSLQVLEVLVGSQCAGNAEKADTLAKSVLAAERQGREILLYPSGLKIELALEALVPRVHQFIYT